MKKLKLLAILLLVMITPITTGGCTTTGGCGNNRDNGVNNPDGKIAFEERAFAGDFCLTNFNGTDRICALIRSSSELTSFFNSRMVTWDSAPIWESYNNAFFEDNALMLFFFYSRSGMLGSQISFAVDSVEVKNNVLTLNILSNTYSHMISDIILTIPFMVEISNENIQGITGFSVNFIAGQQPQ